MTCKSRWDVAWGPTRRELADQYIAEGKAVRRKNGQWDRRYAASRFVDAFERDMPSIFA